MRFIEGLRDDLRTPVLIQCPSTLDTAFVLAQLQDEVSTPGRRPDYKYEATRSSSKTTAWPLPPPPKPDKPNTIHAEDRRIADVARPKQAEEKFAALRSYRRAQGLCQYCAEKWHRGHNALIKFNCMHYRRLWIYFSHLMIMALQLGPVRQKSSCFSLCQ